MGHSVEQDPQASASNAAPTSRGSASQTRDPQRQPLISPQTTWAHISEIATESFRFITFFFWLLVLGPFHDLPPEEQAKARQQACKAKKRKKQRARAGPKPTPTELGSLHDTYTLERWPGSDEVILSVDRDTVTHDSRGLKQVVDAYAHLGDEGAELHTLVPYLGPDEPTSFPSFEFPHNGNLTTFLRTTCSWPRLTHPLIPAHASESALPLHWLLNAASALSFLHRRDVVHRALSLNNLWLTPTFSAALFDLTLSSFASPGAERLQCSNMMLEGWVRFPVDDMDPAYYSGPTVLEDELALWTAMDVFDFGTLTWRLSTRSLEGGPGWEVPSKREGEKDWSMRDLRTRLQEMVSREEEGGRYEPLGMEVARKCWRLEYRDGSEIVEGLKKVVEEIGLTPGEDEVDGVSEALEEYARTYTPKNLRLGD